MSAVNQRHEPGEIVTAVPTGAEGVTLVGELVEPYTSGPGNPSRVTVKVGADTLYLNSNYWGLSFSPKPLPTTPGSVVDKDGAVYGLSDDEDDIPWRRLGGNEGPSYAEWVGTNVLAGATVLFDAGA